MGYDGTCNYQLFILSRSVLYLLFHSSPPSDVHTHDTLLSALIPQQVKPPFQPSAINYPPLHHILVLPLQQDVPHFQPSAVRADPPPSLFV